MLRRLSCTTGRKTRRRRNVCTDMNFCCRNRQNHGRLNVETPRTAAAATAGDKDAAAPYKHIAPSELNPSERTGPAILWSVHHASRSSGPVGGTDKGWLAEAEEKLALQYCRPREPAIANHRTRHEVNHQVSRRRVAFDARNRVPEWPWPISTLARDRFFCGGTAVFKDAATSTTYVAAATACQRGRCNREVWTRPENVRRNMS